MVTGIDSIATQGTAAPSATPIPQNRPVHIQPGTERGRFSDRRHKDQSTGGESFKAALEQVDDAASRFLAEVQARKAERQIASENSARPEKRPTKTPAEVAADEGANLFAEVHAVQSRAPTRQADDNSGVAAQPHIPSSHEFLVAASRYAERFFSVKGAFAKPGESLELSA